MHFQNGTVTINKIYFCRYCVFKELSSRTLVLIECSFFFCQNYSFPYYIHIK